jgi:hypothetical protein
MKKNKYERREEMKKIFSILLALVLALSFSLVAVPVVANGPHQNTVESSTMIFEGDLTDAGGGVYTGTIDMTEGEYYVTGGPGEGVSTGGGFDVYAEEGGCAYCLNYYGTGAWNCDGTDTYIVGNYTGTNHDAYPTPGGPWGSWYNPDCADWNQYSLELTEDHWYLRYTSTAESPMSGVMYWYGDGTGYAAETDKGTLDDDDNGVVDGVYDLGGPAMWDWDAGAQVERIPLEYPGFAVEVTPGSYIVTLTPAEGPVKNLNTSVTYGTIQLAIDDASPGDTIEASAGTYDEQVVIDKELTLQGVGDTTIVKPSSAATLTTVLTGLFWAGGTKNIAGIIVANVADGSSVTIKDLKVDESSVTTKPATADYLAGIFYRETGGTVDTVSVVGGGAWSGTDRAYGMYLSAATNTVSVEVKGSTITNYDKNGIEAMGNTLTADIHNNTVTGRGPTLVGDEVQNGVSVGRDAVATVNYNTISNLEYGPKTWWAAGIIVYHYVTPTGKSATANNNNITNCQIGIMFKNANATAQDNIVSGGTVGLAGIHAQPNYAGAYTASFVHNTVSGITDYSAIDAETYATLTPGTGATLTVTISNNTLTGGYGLADGIYVGGGAGNVTATISDNTISGCPEHGINLGDACVAGATITCNTIINNAMSGLYIDAAVNAANVNANFNNIVGNTLYGANNAGTGTLDARYNWWGAASGPAGVGPGTGDEVSDNVLFYPWLHAEADCLNPGYLLDHFKVYSASGLPINQPVYLEDQFHEGEPFEAVVVSPLFFGNPAEKEHDGTVTEIQNANDHLTVYNLTPLEGETQTWYVEVYNQFGSQNFTVSDPVMLAVPTWKAGHYENVGPDHYLLYPVVDAEPLEVSVNLTDQFGYEYETAVVLAPVYFANPVVKTDGGGPTSIEDPYAHLVFYQIVGAPYLGPDVFIENQFGLAILDVSNPALLAVPSDKTWYGVPCEAAGTFTSQRYQPGEWDYAISITRTEAGDFVSGTIELTAPDEGKVVGVVEEVKCNYAHWYNHPLVSKPNFAAVGTATYGAWTGNFMFLFADSHIQMVLGEDDYDTEWAAETLWSYGDRDYDIWGDDGGFWIDCLCPVITCETAETFTSDRHLPGTWSYDISITRTEAGDFVSGTIVLTDTASVQVEAEIAEVKCDYAHWYNHPLVSKPNFAAVGTATYGAWTGNFMFLFADSHIQMVLSEDDYDTEWAAETLWSYGDRDYDIWGDDGDFWVDCLCPE